MLKNYINCAKKIKNKLITNERIRQILFYNTEDALSKEIPSETEILKSNYILTKPMESLSLNNLENMQSTFISIIVENISFGENSNAAAIQISVACSNDIWDLNEGGRLLLLSEEIINMVRYQQFSFAGKMELDSMEIAHYNGNLTGYDLLFLITDENQTNVEII